MSHDIPGFHRHAPLAGAPPSPAALGIAFVGAGLVISGIILMFAGLDTAFTIATGLGILLFALAGIILILDRDRVTKTGYIIESGEARFYFHDQIARAAPLAAVIRVKRRYASTGDLRYIALYDAADQPMVILGPGTENLGILDDCIRTLTPRAEIVTRWEKPWDTHAEKLLFALSFPGWLLFAYLFLLGPWENHLSGSAAGVICWLIFLFHRTLALCFSRRRCKRDPDAPEFCADDFKSVALSVGFFLLAALFVAIRWK